MASLINLQCVERSMKKKRPDFWTIVFWVSITTVFLWLIAKQLGFFNAPFIVEIVPYLGGFLALLAVAKQVGKLVERLNRAVTDISETKGEIKDIKNEMVQLTIQMATFDKRLTVIEAKLA